MNNQDGFSSIIVGLVIIIVLVVGYTVQHSIAVHDGQSKIKDQAAALHINGNLESTACNSGDGLDSGPSCTFAYRTDVKKVSDALSSAGYKSAGNGYYTKQDGPAVYLYSNTSLTSLRIGG